MLVQGTAPRSLLLTRFRETPHAVLLATSSFWQGVDVVGEALSCVIIDKLPFALARRSDHRGADRGHRRARRRPVRRVPGAAGDPRAAAGARAADPAPPRPRRARGARSAAADDGLRPALPGVAAAGADHIGSRGHRALLRVDCGAARAPILKDRFCTIPAAKRVHGADAGAHRVRHGMRSVSRRGLAWAGARSPSWPGHALSCSCGTSIGRRSTPTCGASQRRPQGRPSRTGGTRPAAAVHDVFRRNADARRQRRRCLAPCRSSKGCGPVSGHHRARHQQGSRRNFGSKLGAF